MEIKDRLKERRLELGLTLEQVAKAVGTSKQTIHRYETGIISNIPSDKIEAMAKVLKVSPAYIMGWEEIEELYNTTEDMFGSYKKLHNDLTQLETEYANLEERLRLEELFCSLNEDGQIRLLDYAEDLVASGRYIKSDNVSKEA